MSEANPYHREYRSSHPETHAFVDPREYSSTSINRNRYDSPRRVRDVSWISSSQQPAPNHDPYERWIPPPEPSEFTIHDPPMAHSSPIRPTTMPSPMIGEYMAVEEDPQYEAEEGEALDENDYADDEGIDFEFPSAPNNNTGARKGARRWVGGFVQGLRRFPGLRKSSRRPSPDVAFSPRPQEENEPQMPTIASLNLRPLTPSLIAQTVEYMDMPKPQVQQPPSPQRYLHRHSHRRKPPPPIPSSPNYSPAADAVPQVLSTVSEHSGEQTGLRETHSRPHSIHSSHSHSRPHSHPPHAHSPPHSRRHSSQSAAHPVVPGNANAQIAPPASAPTVTDYITVPMPSPSSPPPRGLKRFLHNVERLPWIENEQIVDSYFPGRSSRHRRYPNSPADGWKPASSWYNNRHPALPISMTGPSGATLLYGWPPQIQKGYSQPEVQFPHGYTPAQPVFLYPSAFPPPGMVDVPR